MTREYSEITIDQFGLKDVIKLPRESTVGKAIDLMAEHGVRHIPVVDDDDEIIGIINPTCVLRSLQKDTSTLSFFLKIEEMMCQEFKLISPKESLFEVVEYIARNPYNAAVITDEANRVVGIFTDIDILDTDFLWMNFTDIAIQVNSHLGQEINEFTCAMTENTIQQTLRLMAELDLDHVGLMEADTKKFTGVLSFFDLIRHLHYITFKQKLPLENEIHKPIYSIIPSSGVYFTEPVLLSTVRRQLYINEEMYVVIMNRKGKSERIISINELVDYLIKNSDYFPNY